MTSSVPERDAVLAALADWAERGWMRLLDAALSRLVADLCPSADGVVLLATALVAQVEGQGHACLDVAALLADPAGTLRWDAAAADDLHRLLALLPRDAEAWVARLADCEAVAVGDEQGAQPLVLDGRRLYLRRYHRYERRVAMSVIARTGTFAPVDEPAARHALDRLFPDAPADGGTDWQKVACAIALRGRLTIVTGGPGTGKTFTAARLLALLYLVATDRDGLRIALAAPTGKAAARLDQAITGALDDLRERLGPASPIASLAARIDPARTLHALLGTRPGTRRFRHDAARPLDVDLLIVDEASMVHVELMDALLDALPAHARVLLLGDKDQLASVEAGAVLGELCRDAARARYDAGTTRFVAAVAGIALPTACLDAHGPALAQQTVMLRVSRRFGGDIGALARAVNAGDADAAEAVLTKAPDGPAVRMRSVTTGTVVELARHGRGGASGGHARYLETMARRPSGADADADADVDAHASWVRRVLADFDTFRVLCAVREGDWGVSGVNRAIADRLARDGLLSRTGDWYEGRPVLVTRNDYALGVFNGDIGIALRGPGNALRAWFADGEAVRSVGVGRLGHVETAFAMTVHQSQGSEFDHTVLVLPPDASPVATRELVYTGITRARSAFTLVSADADGLAVAIARTTRRASGLRGFVDAHAIA